MTLYDIAAYFLIYSLLGWVVEVIYAVTKTGSVVNRGYLNGPVCPIYGFGMLAILAVLLPCADHKFVLFLGGMVFATLIELFGGWALYHFFHQRWWDYTQEPYNLGGYICARFTVFWGMGAVLVMDMVHPSVWRLVETVPRRAGIAVMTVLYLIYLIDGIVTTNTVMKMKKHLERLDRIAASMREVSDAMTRQIGGGTIAVEQKIGESRVQAALGRAEFEDKMAEARADLAERRAEIEDKMAEARSGFAEHRAEVRSDLLERMAELERKRDEIHNELLRSRWTGSGRILRAFPHLKPHFHIPDRTKLKWKNRKRTE